MSLWEALGAASIGTGYLIGGVLASLTSPRLVFAVAAVSVAAVTLMIHRALPLGRARHDSKPLGPYAVSAQEERDLQAAAA